MVRGKWFPMGEEIDIPLQIRQAVFQKGKDAIDDSAQQVVVYDADEPVGAARLSWQDGAFVIDQLGVLSHCKGKGFGDLLIRLVLFKALVHGATKIVLTSDASSANFFEKYGFTADETLADGNIAMHIMAENVQLSHCGGNCAGCQNQTEACMPKAMR